MDVLGLQALVAAIETGSVSDAARRLNRTQSSISLRLKKLEDKLSVALLERATDGVVPTEQGKILYEHAVHIIEAIAEARKAVTVRNGQRVIRIGFLEITPSEKLDDVIRRMTLERIQFDIKIGMTDELARMVQERDLDIAIVSSGAASFKCHRTPLYRERLLLISSMSQKDMIRLADIADYPFYVHSNRSASRQNLECLFAEAGRRPQRIIECGSYDILFSTLSIAPGFALASESAIKDMAPRHKIRVHDVHGRFSTFPIDEIRLQDETYPEVRLVSKIIEDVFRSA